MKAFMNFCEKILKLKPYSENVQIQGNGDAQDYQQMGNQDLKRISMIHIIQENKKILAVALFVLIILGFLAAIHQDDTKIQTNQTAQGNASKLLLTQIKNVDSELQALEASPQNPAAVTAGLAKVQTGVDGLTSTVLGMKDDMDSQISDLKKAVSSNPNDHQYLDSKDLPFKVTSVDVISQEPFVSINYENHITPIGVGSAIAGWELSSADYETASAEFKNSKDQYIKVTVNG